MSNITKKREGRALWSVSARDVLRCLNNLTQRRLSRSRVPEAESVLQAVEMGLLQDPVDLQVGSRVSGRSQVWGVTGADGGVGVRHTPAGAARSSGMLRRADAALAQGGLRMQKWSTSDALRAKDRAILAPQGRSGCRVIVNKEDQKWASNVLPTGSGRNYWELEI